MYTCLVNDSILINQCSSLMHETEISLNSTLYLKAWMSDLHCTIKDN